jgi:hypothetical protein
MRGLSTALVLFAFAANAAPDSDIELRRDEADLTALVDSVLPRAERLLARQQFFLPFAAALDAAGKIRLFEGPKAKSLDDLDEVVLEVASALRLIAMKGEARAVCLVVLVHVAPPGVKEKDDTIWIRAEHASGFSNSIFYPYDLDDEEGVVLGDPYSVREPPDFFAPP